MRTTMTKNQTMTTMKKSPTTEAELLAKIIETLRENGLDIDKDTVYARVQSNTDGVIAEVTFEDFFDK